MAHKIIVKVNNSSTSGSTGVGINKIIRSFTYEAISRLSVDIDHIFLPKIQFFFATIVETGYRIPIIPAQGGQDAMSGHYPANVTNYRPGRDNLTCEGGQLSCRNFEIGFNNMINLVNDLNNSSFHNFQSS